ncbi:CvpA family protein [Aerolutibacter ruishenii]|uniref:Membrane protein required for colicin V production n=1 Tax=Aerolutibacter ruishenii TaxID=686800 RepID=A0A562LKL9_9GAMM|nr:CvpA family protein [Lysobacter ruishenii]TWI08164.1 membrane protein required for colicin V production [Lysobacter ruishenii]
MGAVDWVLLAIIGASALLGVMRGFIGVVASLVAWLLGAWVAFRHGGDVALLLASNGEPGAAELFGGYALAFIAVMVVVGVVGWLVRKLVQSAGLGGMDRMLGFMLGLVRGGFVACALVLILALTSLPREPQWRASPVVPVLVPGAQWLRGWLPDWVAAQVDFNGEGGASAPVSQDKAAALPAPAISG